MELENEYQEIINELNALKDYQDKKSKIMIKIHDYVAVLKNIQDTNILRDTTGIVVVKPSDKHYLIEFSDVDGQVYEQISIKKDNLLVLYQIKDSQKLAASEIS